MFSLAQAHALLPDSVLVGDPHAAAQLPISRVHTDTRTLAAGDLFIALRGERFDAHDFLPQARAAGAVAAVVEHSALAQLEAAGLPGLLVADTRMALGELAAGWRAGYTGPLIAITGSNGKTTVTQMVAAILRAWVGEAAHATRGNLNNEIGVPLTLLGLRPAHLPQPHRAAVVELGMNHPGEIALLAGWAAPTVALVNNAQREHQEFMESVEAVARENGSVLQALPADGVAVFPADDAAHTPLWRELAGARRVLTFSDQAAADVSGQATWQGDHWQLHLVTPQGEADLALRIAGAHNVRNALAATACALAAGCPLEAAVRGLASFEPVKGRSQVQLLTLDGQAVTLVDDSYNANPDSVRAAIDLLAALPGPRWLVLGDMGEVGDQGPAFHEEVGAHARQQGIEHLWCAGALCAHAAQAYSGSGQPGASARHAAQAADLVAALVDRPQARSILVKGSRFMKMEQVVAALQAAAQRQQEQGGGAC
ncbi:MAG: UDP-N-acetylmuramoyl-tripeptide--D-alanyl-D-alanine ligase [Pseudomonadota bacterium]